MTTPSAPPLERLRHGSKILGNYWRRGDRCASKWAISCEDASDQQTHFCRAKMQWVELALSQGREFSETSQYAIIEAMKLSEFEASALTMQVEHPTHGLVKVGPKGPLSLRELGTLAAVPGAVPGTLKVMTAFPGARIAGTRGPEDESATGQP